MDNVKMEPAQGGDSATVRSIKDSRTELGSVNFASIESCPQARSRAVALCKSIIQAVENPDEVAMRWAYEVHSQRMCVRLGVDLKIFEHLSQGNKVALSASELAQLSGCEESLIVRILRGLTVLGFVAEEGPRSYKATRYTESFAKPHIASTVVISHNYPGAVEARVHEYFQQHGYKTPTSVDKAPFQWFFNTDKTFFDYAYSTPGMPEVFAGMMKGITHVGKPWSDWFPVGEEILRGVEGIESPILVDVGGGTGRDVCAFLKTFPETKGRLVLQDRPDVVQDLSLDGIRCMSYDFFEPQPIRGARVYYMHFILHDWPDIPSISILKTIRAAMKPGYSKLLLHEQVVPDVGAPARIVAMDLSMMCLFGGKERTEGEFRELLAQAGLKLVKVWQPDPAEDGKRVMEAVAE